MFSCFVNPLFPKPVEIASPLTIQRAAISGVFDLKIIFVKHPKSGRFPLTGFAKIPVLNVLGASAVAFQAAATPDLIEALIVLTASAKCLNSSSSSGKYS